MYHSPSITPKCETLMCMFFHRIHPCQRQKVQLLYFTLYIFISLSIVQRNDQKLQFLKIVNIADNQGFQQMLILDIFPRRVWVVPILERFLRGVFWRSSWPCARWHHLPWAPMGRDQSRFFAHPSFPFPQLVRRENCPKCQKTIH